MAVGLGQDRCARQESAVGSELANQLRQQESDYPCCGLSRESARFGEPLECAGAERRFEVRRQNWATLMAAKPRRNHITQTYTAKEIEETVRTTRLLVRHERQQRPRKSGHASQAR
jgi:hypothetical protein